MSRPRTMRTARMWRAAVAAGACVTGAAAAQNAPPGPSVAGQAQPARTLPVPAKDPRDFRVSVLGCLRQNKPAPGLARYVEHRPDLALWVGDNIYADAKDDPGIIQRCYDQLGANPDFQRLRAIAPAMVTWDDHDYGDNNETKHYTLKNESREMFVRFWGLEKEIPSTQTGIWWSRVIETSGKRLQVILLDCRWHRDEPGPSADMLGEAQWAWLGERLAEPADLRLLVTGSQVLLPKEAGSETWDEYPAARDRLFALVREKRAQRVLLVTGDQHYAEVCRRRGSFGYDAIELQFAGINQTEKPEFNPFRVSPCATALHSDAMIDIRWDADDYEPAHVLFRVFNSSTGQVEIAYRVNFSEIEAGSAASGGK
ncbi:MAG: alkaline phosphatase D family protein [Planctomycetota bacterium]|nr:alkaline phosphatase D family protein [Planctomycetota bacterium]